MLGTTKEESMEESIRTQFDDLLASLKAAGGKPVSASQLSSRCAMSQSDVLMWLSVLEKTGQVRIENRFGGVYATWTGMQEEKKEPHTESRQPAPEHSISIARERELGARGRLAPAETAEEARQRHELLLKTAAADLASVSEQLEKVDGMLLKLKEKRAEGEMAEAETPVQRIPPIEAAKGSERGKSSKFAGAAKNGEGLQKAGELAKKEKRAAEEKALKEKEKQESAAALLERIEKEIEFSTPPKDELQGGRVPSIAEETLLPASAFEIGEPAKEKIRPIYPAGKARPDRIKKPSPVQVTGVSLQFSEKLSRQIKRILQQSQAIEAVRKEKEQLLTEHYLPMQRKLESEIETISDRVLRMEKNILALHQRAADLPGKVGSVEKLQQSSIKAYEEMRKIYDEASALIEESTRALSEEREKMEEMVEASRSEIAQHRAKTEELQKALSHISKLEEESANLVISARAALAEQAERLATAEKYSSELSALKSSIKDSVESIKKEIAATKGVLTSIEKQIGQMRHIELWSQSIKEEYEKNMAEIGDYIKHGNEEFDTLREAVEANFVRRYLKELRALTDSYSFEFGQVKAMESNLDARLAEEKRKLEELIEEGRRISYLYETQSREIAGEGKIEERAEAFKSMDKLSEQRQQLQSVIAQVAGNEQQYKEELPGEVSQGKIQPKVKPIARRSAQAKAPEKKPAKRGRKAKKR